jgi:hypothetical protein
MNYDQNTSSLLVCFGDGLVKIYMYAEEMFNTATPIEYQFGDTITSLCLLPNKVIIFGTASGKVRWTNWPFDKGTTPPMFD